MFNPIEAKRRFTKAQIQKSFDSGINLSEEMSLEKAWNVGDEKQYQGVTYYVAGLNAKGQPLWRKKKDGGSAKQSDSKEKSTSSNIRNRIISALKISQVRLMNSSVGKEERMKMITAVENFIKKNPKVDFSDEDLKDMVFGNIDDFEEDYGELKGWDDLKKVQIAYKKALWSNSTSNTKNQTSTPAPRKPDKVSEKEGSALMGKLMEAWELDSNHSFGERKKWESKLVETLNKMGKSAEWFNKNAEVIANADTGEYDDELEKLYDVNGIDDLFDLVREIGDDTENEPVVDSSSNIGDRIISALKADQGGLNNSSAGKKAQMKIIAAAENFMKKNPKVKLSDEDLENIVGGDIDEVEEKYGELKGWDELNDSIELYFDAPIDDDTTGLDAAENKIANSKSDPRDKIAQDAGFKDYEEMKGYQDYVTQKNLLKKKSTSAGMRLLYQQEVAKYEKDHRDLIKRIG